MASRRFNVGEAISAIFDDDFGLFDGERNAEEGEDIYPYLGDPTSPRSTVEELARAVVEDDDDRSAADNPDFTDDDYFEESSDALTRAARLGELESSAGGLGDETVGTESGDKAEEYFPGELCGILAVVMMMKRASPVAVLVTVNLPQAVRKCMEQAMSTSGGGMAVEEVLEGVVEVVGESVVEGVVEVVGESVVEGMVGDMLEKD
jgi:urease gamma subunit